MTFWKNNNADIVKIAIGLIALIIAILVKSFFDDKGFEYLLMLGAIAFFVFVIYLINLFVIFKMQQSFNTKKVEEIVEKFTNAMKLQEEGWESHKEFTTTKIHEIVHRYKAALELKGVEWYYSMEELINFEFNAYPNDPKNPHKEIWVVSKYLEHDEPSAHLNEMIRKNIEENNVKYKYIVPSTGDNGLKFKSENIYRFFTETLRKENPFIFLVEDVFDYPCDLIIFNPSLTHPNDDIIIFMELRVSKDAKERKWAKIENSSARRIFESINADVREERHIVKIEDSILKHIHNSKIS